MSVRADGYEWFTGTEDPLQFPWYDGEAITFKDHPRASTDIVVDDEDPEPEGPLFGPGAGDPSGPQAPTAPGAPPAGNSETTLGTATEGCGGHTDAAKYEVSTTFVKAGEKVDVVFKCLGRTVGMNISNNLKESQIQRLVANMLQVNLHGYWVATVTEGFGRIGALCKESTVTLTPATSEQIQRVVQARTTATSDAKPRKPKKHEPRKATPGTASTNWLAIQASRETPVEWLRFGQELERDKMVHVVTDGGARPNPGAAGWGVLMRQSGRYAINWGHWDMATNNAMEILAVTEALANIPDGMHVWVMTDSAYVKNGITQWVSNWIRNGWKNAGGVRGSNKSLWQKLIAAVGRMKRVEWSWVKAHNGRLLNECADMLATKGVHGEQRPCPVATVRVVGEDVDDTVYELHNGEETPMCGKDGAGYPEGKTYVLKAHAADVPFRKIQLGTQEDLDALVQRIEESLRETRELCAPRQTVDGQAESGAESEDQGDEETFPQPEESNESTGPPGEWSNPEWMAARMDRWMRHAIEQNDWESWRRPDWWSPAWEALWDVRDENGKRLHPGSPLALKVHSQLGYGPDCPGTLWTFGIRRAIGLEIQPRDG
jgi:ribonuclease HI